MASYHYDKSVLKGLGVGPFLGEVKTRNAHIEAAGDDLPVSVFNANRVASALHPHVQHGKIARVIEHRGAKSYVIVPNEARETSALAYFRAGQYVSVALDIDGATVCKPYTIASGPKDALGQQNTSYTLTITENPKGFASAYIPTHWEVGTEVMLSGPLGDFYYQSLRDAKNVVALAGGSGITPFLSMACAIADGTEDFNLTILYGCRTQESILRREELDEIAARSGGKVKVIYILSDEEAAGYAHGFITADLVRRSAPAGDYSVFVCGPQAMYRYLETELAALQLPRRRLRFELSGEYGNPAQDPAYPAACANQTYQITVWIRGESRVVPCRAQQSLLQAMEGAGIHVPSDCRSGQCGWCHSRLISGQVFVPARADGRREADKKFGWIHPCSTYALGPVELEVFPLL